MRLIDADALLNAYDAAHKGPPGGARELIVNAPTANGWISVKDDMPKDSKPVYVWLGRGSVLRGGIPFVGRYEPFREGVWQIWGLDGDKSEIIKVTHWMPIEPPKEEIDGNRK